MSSTKLIYLDANILIDMIEGAGGPSQLLIELFVINDGTKPAFLCTSELTLAEVLVHPFRLKLNHLVEAYDNVLNNMLVLKVGPIDREILSRAAFLRSMHQSLKLPDAMHIATALRLGCTRFLTNDFGIRGEYGLPKFGYDTDQTSCLTSVIRPDELTLQSLMAEFDN